MMRYLPALAAVLWLGGCGQQALMGSLGQMNNPGQWPLPVYVLGPNGLQLAGPIGIIVQPATPAVPVPVPAPTGK